MISSLEWVPKGVADPNPKRYELSKAEKEILEEHGEKENVDIVDDESNGGDKEMGLVADQSRVEEGKEGGMSASQIIASRKVDASSLPEDLRIDDYSDDEDGNKIADILIGHDSSGIGMDEDGNVDDDVEIDDNDHNSMDSDDDDDLEDVPDTRDYMPTDVKGLEAMAFGGYAGMADYADEEGSIDSSDVDDANLQPDDALIVVAKTEEDFGSLEVHVYEEKTGNLFVHHDIHLPSYPLSLSHGTINSDGEAGNFIAVGSFDLGIEVWNLDVLDALEPVCILGGEDTSESDAKWLKQFSGSTKNLKNKGKAGTLRPGSHTDAVMALSWNTVHRQVIASGSADKTVKLWDITRADDATGGNAATFTHHSDKIEAVAWHPIEGTILATGSYDQSVSIVDARSSNNNGNNKKAKLPADCESIAWDPHNTHLLTAASEDGSVLCWDVRKFDKEAYWRFVAHELGGCSDISYNINVPGLLATCAIDKTVALWDTSNVNDNPNHSPFCCGTKDMNVGKLYTVSFYPSSLCLLGCGGGGGQISLWDLSGEDIFQKRFGNRVNLSIEDQTNEKNKVEDFEAIMAAGDDNTTKETIKKVGNGKKGKKKKKKKAHHKGR